MTGFDIAVAVVITLSALIGLWRGVIREVFALAAWVAAIICMFIFGEQLAQVLPFARDTLWLRMLAGYALVFLGVFVTLSVVGFLFSHNVSRANGKTCASCSPNTNMQMIAATQAASANTSRITPRHKPIKAESVITTATAISKDRKSVV